MAIYDAGYLKLSMKILLIEDNIELAHLVKGKLTQFRMHADLAHTGEEGLRMSKLAYYDVILVDLLLDIALNGLQIIRLIRKFDSTIPIIVVSGLTDIETKITSFDAGADDYLPKPIDFNELAARITRLYYRISRPYINQVCYRGITYDVQKRCVQFENQKIHLKNKESMLFEYLIHHPDRIISRQELIASVWHLNMDPETNIVDVSVRSLREKVDRIIGRKLIHSIYGVGYRFSL